MTLKPFIQPVLSGNMESYRDFVSLMIKTINNTEQIDVITSEGATNTRLNAGVLSIIIYGTINNILDIQTIDTPISGRISVK